jgi:hypothetical protein
MSLPLLGMLFVSGFSLQGVILAAFVILEVLRNGCKEGFAGNKFVLLTFFTNLFLLLSCVFVLMENGSRYGFPFSIDPQVSSIMQFFWQLCVVASLAAHITLLYLRLEAVFASASDSWEFSGSCLLCLSF